MRTMQFLVVGCMVLLTTGLFAQHRPQPRVTGNVSVNIGLGTPHRPVPPPRPVVYHDHHHCNHPSHYRGNGHYHGKGHGHHHGKGHGGHHHGHHRGPGRR